jgi:phosphohistidine phosphatase
LEVTVNIYVIRHADALALGERGITQDAERPLSEEGELQARSIGTGLQRKGIHLDKMVTSPFLRARQTVEGILRGWETAPPEVHTCPHLVPDGKPKKLAKFLRGLSCDNVAVVGHQPHLGIFTAWLIGSKKAQIDIAKAGAACVNCDEPRKGAGLLRWLVPPEWLT